MGIKPRLNQQQCRSNIVECYKVECCFDKVERAFQLNVALTLLLVWTGLLQLVARVCLRQLSLLYFGTAGKGLSEEDRVRSAAQHLPAAGDRPDAEGADRGPVNTGRSQAGYRRHHYHVGEPAKRARLHVRFAHTKRLAQGLSACSCRPRPGFTHTTLC